MKYFSRRKTLRIRTGRGPAGFDLEPMEARRLMAAVLDTPIQLPTDAQSAVVAGDQAIFYSSYQANAVTGGGYDPATGAFTPSALPAPMAAGSTLGVDLFGINQGITTLGTKTFFAGGTIPHLNGSGSGIFDTVDTASIYDRSTGLWSTAPLSAPRDGITALTVGDKALFAGGYPASSAGGPFGGSDVVDLYDSATGNWTAAHLSAPSQHVASAIVGHRAYFTSGSSADKAVPLIDVFDADTGRWSTLASPAGMVHVQSATAVGAKVIFLAHFPLTPGDFASGSVTLKAEIYDTRTGRWTDDNLGTSVFFPNIGVVGDQAVFVGGNSPTRIARVYSARTGTWSVSRPPKGLTPDSATSFVYRHQLAFARFGALDFYNPATRRWSTVEMPIHVGLKAVFQVVGQRIFEYAAGPAAVQNDFHPYYGNGQVDVLTFVHSRDRLPPVVTVPAGGAAMTQGRYAFAWSSTPRPSGYDVLIDEALIETVTNNFWTPGYLSLAPGRHVIRIIAHVGRHSIKGPPTDFTMTA